MNTELVITNDLDPWRNLAMEEYILDRVKDRQCILYLWQNQNTVVIGKNQNPWRECRTQLLENEGGKLARRSSGGGAVFHDIGNLNFSFLVDRKFFNIDKQLKVILGALKNLGIDAIFSGRNDLTVEGKKFSGNAFCYRKHSALHHGTILVATNMDKMTRYLQVSEEKIKTKGIKSVRSRVVNLSEYKNGLDIPEMIDALSDSFQNIYGKVSYIKKDEEGIDRRVLDKLYEKYSSWEWRFGESPKFDIELETRFSWGGIHIGFRLKQGSIEKAFVYSDAMDETFIMMLPNIFEGCLLHSKDISKALDDTRFSGERQSMIRDIANWIDNKEF